MVKLLVFLVCCLHLFSEKLELFVRYSCPYCERVLEKIEELNLTDDVVILNISTNSEARKQLLQVGGKLQVPCLFVDGKPLYESKEIIEWLEKYKNGQQAPLKKPSQNPPNTNQDLNQKPKNSSCTVSEKCAIF